MQWQAEKKDWPHSQASCFVQTASANWHVQRQGNNSKDRLLLLHGSGATTHSFAELCNQLKDEFEILALDLPGHGFSSELKTGAPNLVNVARAIDEVLKMEEYDPDLIVAHSAGAAIAVEMMAQDLVSPKAFVAINGAFYPFPGFAGSFFPAMAKLLFLNPFVPSLFSIAASKSRVTRLMESTGSRLNKKQIGYYERALVSSAHIRGTLAMMANWQLDSMRDKLRRILIPTCLLIGGKDGTIDPSASLDTQKIMPNGSRKLMPGYGHLVHEEAPFEVAGVIRDFWTQVQDSKS